MDGASTPSPAPSPPTRRPLTRRPLPLARPTVAHAMSAAVFRLLPVPAPPLSTARGRGKPLSRNHLHPSPCRPSAPPPSPLPAPAGTLPTPAKPLIEALAPGSSLSVPMRLEAPRPREVLLRQPPSPTSSAPTPCANGRAPPPRGHPAPRGRPALRGRLVQRGRLAARRLLPLARTNHHPPRLHELLATSVPP